MNRNTLGNKPQDDANEAVRAAHGAFRATFDRQAALMDGRQDETPNRSRPAFHDPRTMEPTLGAIVFSSDDAELGQVADVDRAHFQVTPASGHAFWLSNDHILSAADSFVRLVITSSEIDEFRISRARGETWEPPALDPLQDGLLTTAEQQDQRERMEKELRSQVQLLPRA